MSLLYNTAYILKFPTTSGAKSLTTKDLGGNDLIDSDVDPTGKNRIYYWCFWTKQP